MIKTRGTWAPGGMAINRVACRYTADKSENGCPHAQANKPKTKRQQEIYCTCSWCSEWNSSSLCIGGRPSSRERKNVPPKRRSTKALAFLSCLYSMRRDFLLCNTAETINPLVKDAAAHKLMHPSGSHSKQQKFERFAIIGHESNTQCLVLATCFCSVQHHTRSTASLRATLMLFTGARFRPKASECVLEDCQDSKGFFFAFLRVSLLAAKGTLRLDPFAIIPGIRQSHSILPQICYYKPRNVIRHRTTAAYFDGAVPEYCLQHGL
jgi:hypothetical protein